MSAEPRPSGYVMTLEAHRKQMAAAEARHVRKSNELWFQLGDVKDKVRELVAVRLAKPGSDDEQRVWDELMELVNDER